MAGLSISRMLGFNPNIPAKKRKKKKEVRKIQAGLQKGAELALGTIIVTSLVPLIKGAGR